MYLVGRLSYLRAYDRNRRLMLTLLLSSISESRWRDELPIALLLRLPNIRCATTAGWLADNRTTRARG